jgi:hypothetical protein
MTESTMRKYAMLSRCQTYRYSLRRTWNEDLPGVLFIMLNPSTADAEIDDPTIRRCIGFAKAWGCGCISVVNLFAFRTPSPAVMMANGLESAVGPLNDAHIKELIEAFRDPGDYIVAAWGSHGSDKRIKWRVDEVVSMLPLGELSALGFTKNADPRHPLYCRADLTPMPWQGNHGR